MGHRVLRHSSVDAFLEAAGAFLAEREAEHNLIFGICHQMRATPELFADDPVELLTVVDERDRVIGASLRTPPQNPILSELDDPSAVEALVDEFVTGDMPGVLGPKEHAAHFAERWSERTGQRAELAVAERIFRLDAVLPPRPTAGAWRVAASGDRARAAGWLLDFVREALPADELPEPEQADAAVGRWIEGIGRRLYVWEVEGRIVSMVAAGGETPNGIRIGPVYTPPEERGRGYGTALTAAVSQDQLDRGRRFCFLYTDLANPTSNRIYASIGYRPVRDVDQYRFVDA
ncbi:MAG: GNAT family N-acetyltransferase [Chloroflexi bacterium]|nr:GNAT family N-acetyltransferase [Chloroflexota bacterium]